MDIILKNRIKVSRVERNLTQQQLAELVGSSRQTIAIIERCKQDPSYVLAHKIAIALDKDINEVFKLEGA